jgi:hypothetical protein
LVVGAEQLETDVEVERDAAVRVPLTELRQRYEFLKEIGGLVEKVQEASRTCGTIVVQINDLFEEAAGDVPVSVRTVAKNVLDEAERIRSELVGSGESVSPGNSSLQRDLTAIYTELDGGGVRQGTLHGPRKVQKERYSVFKRQAEGQLELLRGLIETSIPDLNLRIAEAGLPWIRVQ